MKSWRTCCRSLMLWTVRYEDDCGGLWRRLGRRARVDEVKVEALRLRKEQARLSLEGGAQICSPEEVATPIEHEPRTYVHDIVHPHHEHDFWSYAVFAVQELEEGRAVFAVAWCWLAALRSFISSGTHVMIRA